MPGGNYDAIVIGGGPGGSTAATFLAQAGCAVLLLEKEHFPRFHIGESLLPYNRDIFEEMGVLPALEAAGFTLKLGAQFHMGNSSKRLKLKFQNGRFTRQTTAFQVERATFDHLLLNHARASGAEVREGWTVMTHETGPDSVTVQARDGVNPPAEFSARFLIDSSGRANVTGNQEGLRTVHPRLKKIALFSHFEGVAMDEGPAAGDIVIVRLENKWFWLIPLAPSRVSVGLVMDQEEFAVAKAPTAEVFARIWQSSREMRARLARARAIMPIQATADFSYYNRRLVGPRLLRVGDAAGFMDPIFSAGVYLAMFSGRLAARTVLAARDRASDRARLFAAYERRIFRAMQFYWEMVEAFYTRPFMELFLEPRAKFSLPDAITAILAGELEGGWAMEWRRRLFFWLVRLQGRWPLVPRVSFADEPTPPPPS